MAVLELDAKNLEKLQQALEDFQGNAEVSINEVLHGEAPDWVINSIKKLMPVSGRSWRGKKPAAKISNSLADRDKSSNLSLTVGTKNNWHYLYFPDDGSTTQRHVGNQQFFYRGGEEAQDQIVERCIEKLVNTFEKGE